MNQTKLQRKVCVKLFDTVLARNQTALMDACTQISPQASALTLTLTLTQYM